MSNLSCSSYQFAGLQGGKLKLGMEKRGASNGIGQNDWKTARTENKKNTTDLNLINVLKQIACYADHCHTLVKRQASTIHCST